MKIESPVFGSTEIADDKVIEFPAGLRANFVAPLVINASARRGMQKVINRRGREIVLRAIE